MHADALTGPRYNVALFAYGGMMTLVEFIVIALAVWRVVNFIYDERWVGPFDILPRLRWALGLRHDEKSRPAVAARPTWRVPIAEMHQCIYCMSVWYGLVAVVLWLLVPEIVFVVALPFAIAAMVAIVQRFVQHG
jgi:hypothetical protein